MPEDVLQAGLCEVEAARRAIVGRLRALPAERVPVDAARGRYLAETVLARAPLPRFSASEMDGYALRFDEVSGPSVAAPLTLEVAFAVMAGEGAPGPLPPGLAARIMTGAPLPDGADCVAPHEWTDRGEARVVLHQAPDARWTFVRRRGSDYREGDPVVRAGERLTARAVGGAVAAGGVSDLACARRPRVALIATGDELRPPGSPLAPGEIHESNRFVLRGGCDREGAIVHDYGLVADDAEALAHALDDATASCDVVVTTGGVSRGARDLCRPALAERADTVVEGVLLKPGKPFYAGVRDGKLLLGLPGNPAAVLVCFELFCAPALRRLQGGSRVEPRLLGARLVRDVETTPRREAYLRAVLASDGAERTAEPLPRQGSGSVRSLAEASCLVRVPLGAGRLARGAVVQVLPLAEGAP